MWRGWKGMGGDGMHVGGDGREWYEWDSMKRIDGLPRGWGGYGWDGR